MPLLLLDFDGVILRKHPIYDTISVRCQNYAQRFVGIRNPVKMQQLNKEMYESYGHTVLGLKAMGYADANINEFNHHVYGSLDLKSLYNIKETHKKDIQDVKELLRRVGDCDDVRVRLFTNAPDIWCSTVLSLMGLENERDILSKVNTLGYLKPEMISYERVERQFPTERHFVFVDDKMINLRGVMKRPTWHRVLYTGADASENHSYELPSISVLNSMKHLIDTAAWKRAYASRSKDKKKAGKMINHTAI